MQTAVLLIQGGGKGTHDKWDNRLRDSLERELGSGYAIRYPRMPHEADPKYATWKSALKRHVAGLDDGAILVGHSIGGMILLRALVDDPPTRTFAGIFLIAPPFVGDGGWQSDDIEPMVDLTETLPARTAIYLYHGSADETVPFTHVDLYARAIPQAVVRRLSGRDHQLNNDLSEVAADIRGLGAVPTSAERQGRSGYLKNSSKVS